ncbi:MAG TPA: hypothetical protein VFC82_09680, partial [Actinomycetaceae bacterium]|nr:hypothetical protein [Actinomycetaceae bacterium]
MTAVVVVADPALLTEAISWSAIGLLGETLWLDRSDVRAGRSREAWQSVEATLLVPGAEQAQVPLQRHLAEPGDLGTIRVAWVRPADADDSPGLTSIASFALALLSHSVQASFMEVIVPEAIDSLPAIGAVVGNWRRVVVAPEDHASLTAPDAGYVNRSAPITVHAVAALTGRLGGEHPVPPPPRARSVEFVSVVSRHVGGACRATDRAVNHLDHVLPLSTARTIAPTRHELLSDRWLEVDRAADAVLAAADGSLVRIPSQPLDPAAGFLGERSPWYRQPWGPAFKAFLTGFDPEEETAAEQKERELMPGLKADIERAKRDAGQIPPPAVWSALTGLTLSLVDGGDCPGDFTPVIVHGRRAVVEPEYTLPRATDPLGSWPDGDSSLLPELKHRPPVEVARAAMEDVREQLGAGSRPLDAVGEPSSTKRLAVALAQRSKTQREAQQEVLAGVRERT